MPAPHQDQDRQLRRCTLPCPNVGVGLAFCRGFVVASQNLAEGGPAAGTFAEPVTIMVTALIRIRMIRGLLALPMAVVVEGRLV